MYNAIYFYNIKIIIYLISLEVYGEERSGRKYRAANFLSLCGIYLKVVCKVNMLRKQKDHS